jgi:AcrR family transcriptional regulator
MPPEQRREHLLDAALAVILEHGYSGVSIEAIARAAGVTRPVVYDHFPNLNRMLRALVEREERVALGQLENIVPDEAKRLDPPVVLRTAAQRFLEAVSGHPATWRIILLPPDGTPATVRELVDTNRARVLQRIEQLVRWAFERSELPTELDVELTARAVQDLAEAAARMVLTDPSRFTPERYERFVKAVTVVLWPEHGTAD